MPHLNVYDIKQRLTQPITRNNTTKRAERKKSNIFMFTHITEFVTAAIVILLNHKSDSLPSTIKRICYD